MTTNDKDSENKSTGSSDEERLEEIKKEEKEDASAYYASEDSHEKDTTENDMSKSVDAVDEAKEEMSLLKAVAFLGFGMAAIAIVFMLFFLRSLDERVLDVDSTIAKLDAQFAPFKKEVDDKFARVNGDFQQLKNKVGKYERMLAVMELKRALVSIREVTNGASPEVRAKANDVMASIKTLLQQLGEGTAGEPVAPAAIGAPSFAPEPETEPEPETAPETTATAEPVVEETMAEEAAEEQPEEEQPAEETPVGEIELESEDESDAESEDEEEEEEDE